jgi:hypothetical protein
MLMTNILLHSGIISLIYFLIVFLRDKYIIKKERAVKALVTESVIVFASAMLGEFSIQQMDNNIFQKSGPTAFLGKPEF